MLSIPALSMQRGKEVTERLLRFNLRQVQKFNSQQKTQDVIQSKTSSIFNGSKPKKQFSAKDLIKDDILSRLTKYAIPINREGTVLKVKNQEYRYETAALRHFSILRAPRILDNNKLLEGFSALYDRREIFNEPYLYPHYLNGFLLTQFSNGVYQRGSGLLIGDKYGLTARHCFLNSDTQGNTKEEAKSGEFLLGVTRHSTLKKTILKKWKLHESLDIAVFEIDRPIGEDLGWASLRELTNSEFMEALFEVSVTGYPAYKRFLSYYKRQERDMFTMRGPVLKVIKDSLFYDIDTSGGQSGSGITRFKNDTLESYGVHTQGTKDPVEGNEGVRISGDLLTFIEKFIKDSR